MPPSAGSHCWSRPSRSSGAAENSPALPPWFPHDFASSWTQGLSHPFQGYLTILHIFVYFSMSSTPHRSASRSDSAVAELPQFSYCLKMYYSTKRAMLSDPSRARELQISKPENRKSQETNQGLKIPVIPETTEIDLSWFQNFITDGWLAVRRKFLRSAFCITSARHIS